MKLSRTQVWTWVTNIYPKVNPEPGNLLQNDLEGLASFTTSIFKHHTKQGNQCQRDYPDITRNEPGRLSLDPDKENAEKNAGPEFRSSPGLMTFNP